MLVYCSIITYLRFPVVFPKRKEITGALAAASSIDGSVEGSVGGSNGRRVKADTILERDTRLCPRSTGAASRLVKNRNQSA